MQPYDIAKFIRDTDTCILDDALDDLAAYWPDTYREIMHAMILHARYNLDEGEALSVLTDESL